MNTENCPGCGEPVMECPRAGSCTKDCPGYVHISTGQHKCGRIVLDERSLPVLHDHQEGRP